jgi:uncharacterized protein
MTNPNNAFSLITGASLGIGRAFARECAGRGMNLALVSLPEEGLKELCESIELEFKVKTIHLECDLSQEGAAQLVANWIASEGVGVNMLINNAGFGTHGPLLESKHEVNLRMIRLNVMTMYSLTWLMLPELMKQKKAWIINMSSIAGITPTPYKSLYAATKGFIAWFTLGLQKELKDTNVSVSYVAPGGVVTNEKVKARIDAAGWLSRKTAVYPEALATLAIRRALNSKAVTVPGLGGKIGYVMARYLPSRLRLWILEKPMSRKSE